MAQEYTSTYPATFLEPFGELLADYTASELGRPVDISGILPRVAAIDPFTKVAQQRAAKQAGLGTIQYDPEGRIIGFGGGTGIASYEPFLQSAISEIQKGPTGYQQYMSPYQQDVIDEAVRRQQEYGAQREQQLAASAVGQGAFGGSRFDVARGQLQRGTTEAIGKTVADLTAQNYAQAVGRQQEYGAQQQQQLAASAVGQGAFGGGRYDVARGQLQRGTTEAIGKTVADLQAQNYAQAIGRQQQGIANLLAIPGAQQGFEQSLQQGLGVYGAGSQAYNQSILNALQQGEQTAMNFPFQRIQQATNIFGGLASGTPSSPGIPLTTSPYVAGAKGLGSLAGIGGPLSNVIGSVVQGAGNVLGSIFERDGTYSTSSEDGGYDFGSIYSDPYRRNSQGDIYSTGDYIF